MLKVLLLWVPYAHNSFKITLLSVYLCRYKMIWSDINCFQLYSNSNLGNFRYTWNRIFVLCSVPEWSSFTPAGVTLWFVLVFIEEAHGVTEVQPPANQRQALINGPMAWQDTSTFGTRCKHGPTWSYGIFQHPHNTPYLLITRFISTWGGLGRCFCS